MTALKRRLWGLLRMPRSHIWRTAVGGASQGHFLLHAPSAHPTTSQEQELNQALPLRRPAGSLESSRKRPPGCSPSCSHSPPRPAPGRTPAPNAAWQETLGGRSGAPSCGLPAPGDTVPHPPQPQAPSAPLRSAPAPVLCPQGPSPCSLTGTETLSCAQIPAGWIGLS